MRIGSVVELVTDPLVVDVPVTGVVVGDEVGIVVGEEVGVVGVLGDVGVVGVVCEKLANPTPAVNAARSILFIDFLFKKFQV